MYRTREVRTLLAHGLRLPLLRPVKVGGAGVLRKRRRFDAGSRIFQDRLQALAHAGLLGRQAAQLRQGGIEIGQFDQRIGVCCRQISPPGDAITSGTRASSSKQEVLAHRPCSPRW